MSDLRVLYDAHFQRNFVAFMLRDSSFLEHVANYVTAEIFSDESMQRVVRLILDFWKQNRCAPGTSVFRMLDQWLTQGMLNPEVHTLCSKLCDSLFAIPPQNRDYLLSQFDGFLQHQQFAIALPIMVESVRRGEYSEAQEVMKKVFTSRANFASNPGIYVNANIEARNSEREVEDHARLLMLMRPIDERIQGSLPGELGVWQSQQSSAGKTTALIQQAKNYAVQGRNVMLITLEMGQRRFEDRFDQCIAGATRKDIYDDAKMRSKLQGFIRTSGRIHIKKFPSYTTKASMLRDYVRMEEQTTGLKFHAVLIDYADLLAPETKELRGDLYGTGAEVYSYLSAWASEDKVVMWTAMQSGRQAAEEDFADQHHAGGSIAKIQIADVVISINRTAQQATDGETMLFVVKNREGAARFTIPIKTNFNTMQFWSAADDQDWQTRKEEGYTK